MSYNLHEVETFIDALNLDRDTQHAINEVLWAKKASPSEWLHSAGTARRLIADVSAIGVRYQPDKLLSIFNRPGGLLALAAQAAEVEQ